MNYKQILRKPHYHVPNCPSCSSPITGRFVKQHRETDSEWIITESLKNGELVKLVAEVDTDNNLYCEDCGYTWSQPIPLRLSTLEEIEIDKKVKHTTVLLNAFKEETKTEKKKGIIGLLTNFVGKP